MVFIIPKAAFLASCFKLAKKAEIFSAVAGMGESKKY